MSPQNVRSHRPVTWVVVTVLLLASLVGTLWVPFYARTTPKVADFPFFYWYQLLWVPLVAILTWISYLLLRPRPVNPSRRGGGEAR
jgi:hypothetical protein